MNAWSPCSQNYRAGPTSLCSLSLRERVGGEGGSPRPTPHSHDAPYLVCLELGSTNRWGRRRRNVFSPMPLTFMSSSTFVKLPFFLR